MFQVFGEWKGKSVVLLQANMLGEFGRERLGLHYETWAPAPRPLQP